MDLVRLAESSPIIWWVLGVAAVGILCTWVVYGGGPRQLRRDPTRMFTDAQRREAFLRAGHRCEYETLFLLRCSGAAEHADHFFPWSRGGASSSANLVASCSRHNLAKSNRMPTPGCAARITRRRRGYFPQAAATVPGQWYGRPAGVR